MALTPVSVNGRLLLLELPYGASQQEQWLMAAEQVRIASIQKRRLYTDGSQYTEDNIATAKILGLDPLRHRLEEHDRLHAYSHQIQEAINFVSDQIADGFQLAVQTGQPGDPPPDPPPAEQVLVEGVFEANDRSADGLGDVIRDAAIAGDVPVYVGWDPVVRLPFIEFWESETVRFDFSSRTEVTAVTRTELVWVWDPALGETKQVVERLVYDLISDPLGRGPECRVSTFWDDDEDPRETTMLGVPFLPWALLRIDRRHLRAVRGESLITDQCMDHADRLNANEQLGYLMARFNSHGNLAVVGDAALLEARQEGRIAMDVADVLTFPGGTALQQIMVPSDTSIIQHQEGVLKDAILGTFGLTRVEPETISGGLGGISGYALEILNRKSDGTFRRVRNALSADIITLANMILDVHAYQDGATYTLTDGTPLSAQQLAELTPDTPVLADFWRVDPEAVFPNRDFEVRMGSGYIVDHVALRDDFVAGLISRRQALREDGKDDETIEEIEQEIDDETSKSTPATEGTQFVGGNGSQQAGTLMGSVMRELVTPPANS